MAVKVSENLEWSYQIAREIIGIGHRRAESRYNERLSEKKYKPGSLVSVVQHTHLYGALSKLNPKFSGLCKVLEVRGPTLTLRKLDTNKVFTASQNAMRASTLSRPEVPLQAEPPAELPNTLNAESGSEEFEIGRVENLRLFADDEWLPPSASQIPFLIDLDLTLPPVVSTPMSQSQLTACTQRNVCLLARSASAESSAVPLQSQSSVTFVPLSQSLAPAPNSAQPRPPRADLPPHFAPVRQKTRVIVPITSGAIVTSSYSGYRVANSICDSSNSEPKPHRTANCCIVACRQLQSPRDSRDELIVKKISARDSSNTLVAPPTAENEIAYSTHCFVSRVSRCAQ